MKKLNVAIIGLGKISGIYLENLTGMFKKHVELVGVVDLVQERAKEVAETYQIKQYTSVEELLGDPSVELVLNLTTPQSHFALCKQVLEAGKHVYVEKPLSLTTEEASQLVALANEKHLVLGGAPDTFLGSGIQTCRKLIDDGWIGRPVAASAFMMNHGHESWHPAPEFYYQAGGGPLFDMGPYYITALINLLGPVQSVAGYAKKSFSERLITSEPKNGTSIRVEVDTHIASLLQFHSGCIATLVTSFDVWNHSMPRIEIYGTEGSLRVPDPNTFGGPISYCRMGEKEWTDMPLLFDYPENSRGLGIADIAEALESGSEHRANGDVTRHVVDVMESILKASREHVQILLSSTCKQPSPR
ncbi:MAG: Gfo/Idh/MocA family oxidoreductase [Spirochaetaceae bacterium]|jgi:predicted dehydrogenase|uniref:Gfo/Idh/MocA family oxidoreductase n=1 Tax=Sphaerochaeta halotolerans TaxID=2293840 RepID=A0A372MDT9_9SPIR|nr:Gfo/Idh/MocA family oxidoreductase [Sphaerochaeta halotolerans]MBG0768161.1 Gfo/Idh/MocA family oxidoreductase [Spirochaetaceae bacterium]RFU93957.1 gfo/Idh/MocA family oxidoreductase [Sphaerochaeta halotolerans]